MIAVQLHNRSHVRKQLESMGCVYIGPVDPRNDGYKTAGGFYFTVPALGEDGLCSRSALAEIVADIRRRP